MGAFVLRVDRDGEEPVYVQIARQVREAIASGLLEPGAGLPPVRSLASDLGVNLNTVARGYRLLEDEGFVQLREREGAVVAAPARRAPRAAREGFSIEMRELVARMRQAGFSTEEIESALRRALEAGGAGSGGS
jgi:DNA-binding transcriptional regulator YhcF (GntR family)